MRFKPVYLGFADCPIGKLHGRSSFPLAPAAFAVRAVQISSDVHTPTRGDCLNASNLAEDLEFHRPALQGCERSERPLQGLVRHGTLSLLTLTRKNLDLHTFSEVTLLAKKL